MNIDVERINISNAIIKGSVDEKEFSSKLDEIANKEFKNAKIDGFRTGKTPLKFIKQKFEDQLQERTEQSFVQTIYQDGLTKIGIAKEEILGEPTFDSFDNKNNNINFVMKISLKPVFKIADYNKVVPDIKKQTITKKQVDERIVQLASSYSQPEIVKDRDVVEDKDFVNIDFKGFVDGKAFEGGEAKDFLLEIGSKSFVGNFEKKLIGMKIGEETEIEVSFPKDYQKEELSGKKATFKTKIKTIKAKEILEINDALAQKIIPPQETKSGSKSKAITLSTLEKEVKENLLSEKKNEYYATLKKDFFDALLNSFEDFPLPENIVEQEIIAMSRQKFNEMDDKQIKEMQNSEEKIEALKESCKDEAAKRVQLTFIIEAIAKKEDVSITDQQLMQEIYIEAMQTGQDPKKMYETYKENNLLSALKMALIEEKLTIKIFDKKSNTTAKKTVTKEETAKKSSK